MKEYGNTKNHIIKDFGKKNLIIFKNQNFGESHKLIFKKTVNRLTIALEKVQKSLQTSANMKRKNIIRQNFVKQKHQIQLRSS